MKTSRKKYLLGRFEKALGGVREEVVGENRTIAVKMRVEGDKVRGENVWRIKVGKKGEDNGAAANQR